jgi:hypothetical protein
LSLGKPFGFAKQANLGVCLDWKKETVEKTRTAFLIALAISAFFAIVDFVISGFFDPLTSAKFFFIVFMGVFVLACIWDYIIVKLLALHITEKE